MARLGELLRAAGRWPWRSGRPFGDGTSDAGGRKRRARARNRGGAGPFGNGRPGPPLAFERPWQRPVSTPNPARTPPVAPGSAATSRGELSARARRAGSRRSPSAALHSPLGRALTLATAASRFHFLARPARSQPLGAERERVAASPVGRGSGLRKAQITSLPSAPLLTIHADPMAVRPIGSGRPGFHLEKRGSIPLRAAISPY